MIAFVDLETTGLGAVQERVLEVACVVVDDELREVARFERVANTFRATVIAPKLKEFPSDYQLTTEQCIAACEGFKIDPVVVRMHHANGLWQSSQNAPTFINAIDDELEAFLQQHAPKAQLAGNTINFDRGFMEVHLPRAHAVLHYRNLDVSSFNEAARRWWPEVYAARPRSAAIAHRAMPDVLESVETMRYYRKHLGVRRDAFLAGLDRGESGDIANYYDRADREGRDPGDVAADEFVERGW